MSYDDLPILDYGDRGVVTVAANAEGVANLAVQAFATALITSHANRGRANIALSGGSTPRRMGELLAHSDFPSPEAWENAGIFWGDEHWVPLESDESNAGVALRTFLTKAPIPAENVHPMYDPELDEAQAAAVYQALIEEIVEPVDGVPAFDLDLPRHGRRWPHRVALSFHHWVSASAIGMWPRTSWRSSTRPASPSPPR